MPLVALLLPLLLLFGCAVVEEVLDETSVGFGGWESLGALGLLLSAPLSRSCCSAVPRAAEVRRIPSAHNTKCGKVLAPANSEFHTAPASSRRSRMHDLCSSPLCTAARRGYRDSRVTKQLMRCRPLAMYASHALPPVPGWVRMKLCSPVTMWASRWRGRVLAIFSMLTACLLLLSPRNTPKAPPVSMINSYAMMYYLKEEFKSMCGRI